MVEPRPSFSEEIPLLFFSPFARNLFELRTDIVQHHSIVRSVEFRDMSFEERFRYSSTYKTP